MKASASLVRGLHAIACAGAIVVMFLAPVGAAASSQSLSAPGQTVTPAEMANDACTVSASPTTCQGGYTPTQTFRSNLTRGDVVTVTMSYLYTDSTSVVMSFSDSLGNTPSVISSQCAKSSPIVCTAIGYFRVTNPGRDDIFVTESGGRTGRIWYNAEIWQGQIGRTIFAVGSSSFCAQSCTGQVQLGPLSPLNPKGVIAASAYTAFYPYTPATWQFSFPYSYFATDSGTGGDSVMWQGTSDLAQAYTFSATTSPVPNVWAGSSELLYW